MKKEQPRPGKESLMKPVPESEPQASPYQPKLKGKKVLITGGDSGIGKAVALLFAKEGADIAISYLQETDDATETMKQIQEMGRECILLKGDIARESVCRSLVAKTVKQLGGLDILINNAGLHYEAKEMKEMDLKNMVRTFEVNVFSMIYLVKYALEHMQKGSCIINTASVTAYRGSGHLMDYAATKGAIVAFTRSLAQNLADKGIRVNGVAPGPIWTPLIVSSFEKKELAKFGKKTPLQRVGQPAEVAPAYLFLASETDSSYVTGQFIHPNGGEIVNA